MFQERHISRETEDWNRSRLQTKLKNRFPVHTWLSTERLSDHGIAKVFHDEPQVLHYGRPGTGVILKEGMSFTIEPMINAGKRNIKILPDQWTAVTKDHKLSAQWEHTLMVTKDGFEIFTLRQEEQ